MEVNIGENTEVAIDTNIEVNPGNSPESNLETNNGGNTGRNAYKWMACAIVSAAVIPAILAMATALLLRDSESSLPQPTSKPETSLVYNPEPTICKL